MITVNIKNSQDKLSPFFADGGFNERINKVQRRVFDSLFEDLHCNNPEHKEFENVITASLSEQGPYFKIEKVCCSEFEMRIKNAVM
jgi:hypothetical protein